MIAKIGLTAASNGEKIINSPVGPVFVKLLSREYVIHEI